MGADEVLSKPLYLEELNALVRKYSRRRSTIATSLPNPTSPSHHSATQRSLSSAPSSIRDCDLSFASSSFNSGSGSGSYEQVQSCELVSGKYGRVGGEDIDEECV